MNRNVEEREIVIDGLEAFKEFIKENPDKLIALEVENRTDGEREAVDGRR